MSEKTTLADVKAFLSGGSIKPSELFSKESLQEDPEVSKVIAKKTSSNDEFHQRTLDKTVEDRVEKRLTEFKADLVKTQQGVEVTNKVTETKALAAGMMEKYIKENKVSEAQATFLQTRLKNADFTKVAELDATELQIFLAESITESQAKFESVTKVFGESNANEGSTNEGGREIGSPVGSGVTGLGKRDTFKSGDGTDLTQKANNRMIP